MNLIDWARRWNLPSAALNELVVGLGYERMPVTEAMSEAGVQSRARLRMSQLGWGVWRNNVGVLKDDRGVPVRFGLANDTKQVNEKFKSADLIGIRPIYVTPEWVGYTIGQFVSVEVKEGGWVYTGQGREVAQANWGALVRRFGGHSLMVQHSDEIN